MEIFVCYSKHQGVGHIIFISTKSSANHFNDVNRNTEGHVAPVAPPRIPTTQEQGSLASVYELSMKPHCTRFWRDRQSSQQSQG